jgi:hypothetical protein
VTIDYETVQETMLDQRLAPQIRVFEMGGSLDVKTGRDVPSFESEMLDSIASDVTPNNSTRPGGSCCCRRDKTKIIGKSELTMKIKSDALVETCA